MSLLKIRNALETALDAMPGLIPAATITVSRAGVFTTTTNHLLVSGMSVTILNHSTITGTYLVNVISDTTFSLLNKKTKVAVSVTNGTGGTVKANLTYWEAVDFEPFVGAPYQEVYLMAATPENPTYGSNFYRELGYLQVDLNYPKGVGTAAVTTRAELIRSTFVRGNSYTKDDVIVHIKRTASIENGPVKDGHIGLTVKIPYWADIYQ